MIAKGAPWTRSSLAAFGNGVGNYDGYPAGPSREQYAQQLRGGAAPAGNLYSAASRHTETQAPPRAQGTGSILAFPSAQVRPGDAEQRRAQKQELFDYYQSALREKAHRGKDDLTADPLKARAAELSQQYERERARVRKAIGNSILAPEANYGEGRRGGNSSFSVPAQDSRGRGNPIDDIENLRRKKGMEDATYGLRSSGTANSYQENAANFFGEAPQAAFTPAKLTYSPPVPKVAASSFQENAARFYGEEQSASQRSSKPFELIPQGKPQQAGKSFEENKAAFFGADLDEGRHVSRNSSVASTGKTAADQIRTPLYGDLQQLNFGASPILGKTIPKTTLSDPITGVVRTVSSQRPRFQPLGKEKPDVFVGKINDSPAPSVDVYVNQPSFTKKSGNKPYSYNPLTGQDYEYGNPFRGAPAYLR